jgi:hypothetical protein
MMVTTTGLVIWILLLVVIATILVPLAVGLLRRALRAARKIEVYLADMLEAGLGIGANTAAIPALDQTIEHASAIRPVAERIETKTGAVARLLAQRAG